MIQGLRKWLIYWVVSIVTVLRIEANKLQFHPKPYIYGDSSICPSVPLSSCQPGVSPDPLLWLPLCNRNKIAVGNASTRFFATLTALMEDE
jgi:hypothetical protein